MGPGQLIRNCYWFQRDGFVGKGAAALPGTGVGSHRAAGLEEGRALQGDGLLSAKPGKLPLGQAVCLCRGCQAQVELAAVPRAPPGLPQCPACPCSMEERSAPVPWSF